MQKHTKSFPWDNNPIPLPSNSQDTVIKRAEAYQNYMNQIPVPSHRCSVIPFTSWMGLGRSIKKIYGQPLHYLTNVLLKQWDQLRLGCKDEYKPLDQVIHPCKAEATVWLVEELHRQTASHFHIAQLWKLDPLYLGFLDSVIPNLNLG